MLYDESQCPDPLKRRIDAYVQEGLRCGDFLCAVIANDLFNAMCRADLFNVHMLPFIVAYVQTYVPEKARGSYAAIDSWIDASNLKLSAAGGGGE